MAIYQDNRKYIGRLSWLRIVAVLGVSVLLAKLWYLAVFRFADYSVQANQNQTRLVSLMAPRGFVVDRDDRILVENHGGFDLLLKWDQYKNPVRTLEFLSVGFQLDHRELEKRVAEARLSGNIDSGTILRNLSLQDVGYVLSHGAEFPELEIARRPLRVYRYGELASHVLGYVGEISASELKASKSKDAKGGDIVGKFGLEHTYNTPLTGQDGSEQVRVDSRGRSLEVLETRPPVQGQKLVLTLDLDLQQAADEGLGDHSGAVVVLNPNTGEVLAMVSKPEFDPNRFARGISREQWEELVGDPEKPFQNRTIQSKFSPGSIFKILMALAGLEKGVVTLDTSVFCAGVVNLYGNPFHCWNWEKGGHGRVQLVEALQHSCNIYFYLLGQKLGIREIARFSGELGLGKLTGIDLAGEIPGLVPSPEWKKRVQNRAWYPGETISVSIGQGPIDVTPIQLAKAVGMVATGKAPRLRLIGGGEGYESSTPSFEFKPSHLKAVKEGMWRAVNLFGTARSARVDGFDVCGKTGTVQTISTATRDKLSDEEAARFEPNAWFVGFAPRDNPEIVVTVMVEGGGSGGGTAAPVAGRIFQKAFDKRSRVESDALLLTRLEELTDLPPPSRGQQ
jgi:penicillin-binding protein 2